MKKVVIIGASSGIGRELARIYAARNCRVGVTGRRENLLLELQQEFPDRIVYAAFDVTAGGTAGRLRELISAMGGMDLMIISAGAGYPNKNLEEDPEVKTVDLNVKAFTMLAVFGFNFFRWQNGGHLAVISSVAALRGNREAPAYSASKSYQSVYLEGLRQKVRHEQLPIRITDIRPGFVDTKSARGRIFWMAPVEKAARQIWRAIEKKKEIAYITRRWWLVAQLMKMLPAFIYERI